MNNSPITLIFIIVNVAFSIYAFSNMEVFNRFKFNVGAILKGNEWHRIITGAFLHVNYTHLIVNMITLYLCGPGLENFFSSNTLLSNGGPLPFIILYFGSMIGGDLLSLLIHRNQLSYSAVGASGAISGMIFAISVIAPQDMVLIFFILPCPFWLFAILYVSYSLFGMRSSLHNIGHAAHLGGALTGLFITAAFFPRYAVHNWIFLLILVVPTMLVLLAIILNPTGGQDPLALLKKFFQGRGQGKPAPKFKPTGLEINMQARRQEEIDRLLDKVARHGEESLTPEERRRLKELSGR